MLLLDSCMKLDSFINTIWLLSCLLHECVSATGRGKTIRGTGNFKAVVAKFLSTNSLQSIFTRMVRCGVETSSNHCLNQITLSQRNLSTFLNINSDPKALTSVFGTEVAFFWQTGKFYGCQLRWGMSVIN